MGELQGILPRSLSWITNSEINATLKSLEEAIFYGKGFSEIRTDCYTSVLPMEGTNYNHLFYFWTVARLGSVSKASIELRLSQPTISEQVRKLEESLGVKLFERAGRGLRLSGSGQTAFRYADEIFRVGRELRDALSQGGSVSPSRLAVGVAQSVPTLVAHQLIEPVFRGATQVRLLCVEDRLDQLLSRLALGQLDLILSEAPPPNTSRVKAFSHRLVRSGVTFMAARKPRSAQNFPKLLDAAPFLMPVPDTALYNSLLKWFDGQHIAPNIIGEFSDSTLLATFGQHGAGVFAVPAIVERNVRSQHKVEVIGRTQGIAVEYYAITAGRRISHPALMAIFEASQH